MTAIQLLPAENIKEIVLHELGHALVGPGHGHDDEWQAMAVKVGSNGKRVAEVSVEAIVRERLKGKVQPMKKYADNRRYRPFRRRIPRSEEYDDISKLFDKISTVYKNAAKVLERDRTGMAVEMVQSFGAPSVLERKLSGFARKGSDLADRIMDVLDFAVKMLERFETVARRDPDARVEILPDVKNAMRSVSSVFATGAFMLSTPGSEKKGINNMIDYMDDTFDDVQDARQAIRRYEG